MSTTPIFLQNFTAEKANCSIPGTWDRMQYLSVSLFQFLSPPGIPGTSQGSVTRLPVPGALLNRDRNATYGQTDWHPGLDVFRFSASSSGTEVHTSKRLPSANFQSPPVPGANTRQEQTELLAPPGKELSASAGTGRAQAEASGHRSKCKRQGPPCPLAPS